MNKALLLSAAALVLVGCGGADGDDMNDTTDMVADDSMPMVMNASQQATAAMQDSAGNDLGTLRLTDEGGAIKVEGDLSGLSAGEHAIHIHDIGDCSTEDGSSAGPHWNPTDDRHGKWGDAEGYHRGDIGNFTADANMVGTLTMTTDEWCVDCGDADKDVVGHSIIIHDLVDDFVTQPTGNAGKRLGCGVIELNN